MATSSPALRLKNESETRKRPVECPQQGNNWTPRRLTIHELSSHQINRQQWHNEGEKKMRSRAEQAFGIEFLDAIAEWIGKNEDIKPEDVFPEEKLQQWAKDNDYITKDEAKDLVDDAIEQRAEA